MGKTKNLRVHERFNIYHTRAVNLLVGEKSYPIIDISYGGVSITDDKWDSDLEVDPDITSALISFGSFSTRVDLKAVSFDENQKIIGLMITDYKDESKTIIKNVTDGLKISTKPKKYKLVEKEIGLKVKTQKFQVGINDNGIHILKKSLFTRKSNIPFILLGVILGVPRKKFNMKKIIPLVVDSLDTSK